LVKHISVKKRLTAVTVFTAVYPATPWRQNQHTAYMYR